MRTLRRSLPSLGALVLFGAAARLESFTLAAGELGVTQGAVSRQIKSLEQELNVLLFTRGHRRVTLTPASRVLASATVGAFGQITDALDKVRQMAAPDSVTVGVTLAFMHFWLMPRLPAFRAAQPGIKLCLVAEDAAVDLRRVRRDVVVRYGRRPFEDARSIASCADEVFPVCSLALAEWLDGSPLDFAELPLIESDSSSRCWLTWQDWLSQVGVGDVPIACDLHFNHYTTASTLRWTEQASRLAGPGWSETFSSKGASSSSVIGRSCRKSTTTYTYRRTATHLRPPEVR